jgi:L-threonylcarbamoyladenylate synthase
MSPRVLHVDPTSPREERLRTAAGVLEAGEVVALPTETFYGLAVDAFAPAAVRRLNDLKRKPADSPALLLVSSSEQVGQVARDLPENFHKLAAAFWPGPLTLVVVASDRLPREVSGGRGTVGVRVPGLNLPRRLAECLGRPITGVSANLHGEAPCRTAAEVARALPEGIAMILDGGPSPGGAVSTVLDLSGTTPRLVRAGAVPVTALTPFVPHIEY